ncbi:MAG TPA: hypothetical protein VGC35_04000 [Allosphingosinicella sp.]|jgi:hypothetical protein
MSRGESGITAHFRRHGFIHAGWVIFVLILAIAGLVIVTPAGESLTKYVSFAATVTSLFLGAIAIFYSMISNQSFSETVGSLKSSADDVQIAAKNIADTSTALSGQSERLIEQVSLVPASVNKLSADIAERMEVYAAVEDRPSKEITKPQNGSNIGAVMAMYAVALAANNGREIDTAAIKEETDEYFGGILMGVLSAIKMFEPCGVKIEQVRTHHRLQSLGDLPIDRYLDVNFENVDAMIVKAKAAIDRQLGPQHVSETPDGEKISEERQGGGAVDAGSASD